jgi:hypothetical protein
MLSWITRSDKNCKVTINNRDCDEYPFVLYFGDNLSIMLTKDELNKLHTETNNSLFEFYYDKVEVDG